MSDTCVLAIDYQVCEKKKMHSLEWDIVCENTNRLLTIARSINALVIHCLYVPGFHSSITQMHHPKDFDGRSITIVNSEKMDLIDHADWEVVKLETGVSRCASDRFLVKPDKNAFDRTRLADKLKRRRIKNIITTGFRAHDCVLKTALGSQWSGFNTCIIKECIDQHRFFNAGTIAVLTLAQAVQMLDAKR